MARRGQGRVWKGGGEGGSKMKQAGPCIIFIGVAVAVRVWIILR